MANVDSPFGLKPVMHISGAPWNGATLRCYLATGEANDLFIGDAVDLDGSADTAGNYPTVKKITAGTGNPIFGVITSFEVSTPNDSSSINLQQIYRTGAVAQYCNVCVDPTVLFEIQGDTVATIAATAVGGNANIIMTHSGNTTTGRSGMELNSSAVGTTSTYQLRIMGAVDRPNNSIAYVNAKWLVLINLHRLFACSSNAAAGSTMIGALGA